MLKTSCLFVVGLFALVTNGSLFAAEEIAAEALPAPRMTGGKPLMQALKERQSIREYKSDALSAQQVSDLLWAAFGMNRPEIDHRTAPSAQNTQDIDIYIAVADGLYRYEAKPHRMVKVSERDLRSLTGGQPFVKIAPVQLIYVSDFARMPKVPPKLREMYAGIDAGCIIQNVYLYCASEGLASVVHELNREPLAEAMELRPEQRIIVAQTVGYPK